MLNGVDKSKNYLYSTQALLISWSYMKTSIKELISQDLKEANRLMVRAMTLARQNNMIVSMGEIDQDYKSRAIFFYDARDSSSDEAEPSEWQESEWQESEWQESSHD